MTKHETVNVDGKVVHKHTFDDGSVMVTGLDEAVKKMTEPKADDKVTAEDFRKADMKYKIPYVIMLIFISLPMLVVIGAVIFAFIDVITNGYTYRA